MQNLHKSQSRCPKCGKLLIPPFGNPAAPYLMVGDFPGYHETIAGAPFAFRRKPTETRSGDILRDELNRVGISIQQALLTNLWQHQKSVKLSASKKGKETTISGQYDQGACPLEYHLDQLVRLFTGRTHVLLMGSDVTQALIGEKVNVVSGLQVKVPGFAKVRFWVSPNPSLVMSQPIGEFRLALSRFSEDVKRK